MINKEFRRQVNSFSRVERGWYLHSLNGAVLKSVIKTDIQVSARNTLSKGSVGLNPILIGLCVTCYCYCYHLYMTTLVYVRTWCAILHVHHCDNKFTRLLLLLSRFHHHHRKSQTRSDSWMEYGYRNTFCPVRRNLLSCYLPWASMRGIRMAN